MWTDFARTLLQSFLRAADHPTENTTVGSHFALPQLQIFKNSLYYYIPQIGNCVCTTMNSVVNNKENLINT